MGDFLAFRGKEEKARSAYINSVQISKSREDLTKILRYDIVFESIDDLRFLLNMDSNEIVTINATNIKYEQFRKEILQNTHRIYLSKDGRFFDQVESADIHSALETLSQQE